MTRNEQRISIIASIIAERRQYAEGRDLTYGDARRMNEGGWAYDVRWTDSEYINSTDYTRVEQDQLSDAKLYQARKQSTADIQHTRTRRTRYRLVHAWAERDHSDPDSDYSARIRQGLFFDNAADAFEALGNAKSLDGALAAILTQERTAPDSTPGEYLVLVSEYRPWSGGGSRAGNHIPFTPRGPWMHHHTRNISDLIKRAADEGNIEAEAERLVRIRAENERLTNIPA